MLHTCSMMFYLIHDSGRDQTAADERANQHAPAPVGEGGGRARGGEG